ncbi:pentapeptide repeat-containing protein [Kocuria flava]|uniref:pentapeptide repeat-containing protein n=1 Tax=Kocuria flava TaxID=446860 RepID=UPI001FF13F11|nr:pentapeptide repeat-containing protein [Kocuria flava]MCJ8505539.1 pentapeptide repeat-containing protein [Kocuria flava]
MIAILEGPTILFTYIDQVGLAPLICVVFIVAVTTYNPHLWIPNPKRKDTWPLPIALLGSFALVLYAGYSAYNINQQVKITTDQKLLDEIRSAAIIAPGETYTANNINENITYSNFNGSILEGSFMGSDLSGSDLRDSTVKANISGASLCGVDARGADLRDAQGIEEVRDWSFFRYDYFTRWPPGFSPLKLEGPVWSSWDQTFYKCGDGAPVLQKWEEEPIPSL